MPGLTLHHPGQLAVMHAPVRFAQLAGWTFTANDLHVPDWDTLGRGPAPLPSGVIRLGGEACSICFTLQHTVGFNAA